VLIGESHTRNKFYLENLYQLQSYLQAAGFEVETGGFHDVAPEDRVLTTANNHPLVLHELEVKDRLLQTADTVPELIILNNDLSDGMPEELKNVEQPIAPSPLLGWFNRRKSTYFNHTNQLIEDFSHIISVDPWLLSTYVDSVEQVDFIKQENFDAVAEQIDAMLVRIREKYTEYRITDDPYVFVKADAGTYGMNVLHFFSGKEFLSLNSKNRRKMAKRKGSKAVHAVFIQEGIRTVDVVDGMIGEPVLYSVGTQPVGGFFRTNKGHSDVANLNAKGMDFNNKFLCVLQTDNVDANKATNLTKQHLLVYKTLAQIGALTIGKETENI